MLARGVHPVVPEQGSVGASGDLAPLAHLALVLQGEGDAEVGGERLPGAAALARAGLAPLVLEPKEGLALINGTQAHTAVAALALADALACWQTAHAAGAMTLDALMGTPDAFDPRLHDARGQAGQAESAAILRALLAGSEIRESHRLGDARVQDAYALRCMPQVHGPALDALAFAAGLLARELNAATDNPLVFADGLARERWQLPRPGRCDGGRRGGDRPREPGRHQRAPHRPARPPRPELRAPRVLAVDPGVDSGYMMAQVTAAALASECKTLAVPASVDTIPTGAGKEDVVPMAMGAALKLRRQVANVRRVLAVELLCAARALDLRLPLRAGVGAERARQQVRALVAPLDADRPPAPDLAALEAAVGRRRVRPRRGARGRPAARLGAGGRRGRARPRGVSCRDALRPLQAVPRPALPPQVRVPARAPPAGARALRGHRAVQRALRLLRLLEDAGRGAPRRADHVRRRGALLQPDARHVDGRRAAAAAATSSRSSRA
jgi:histidine ammonia-lyase